MICSGHIFGISDSSSLSVESSSLVGSSFSLTFWLGGFHGGFFHREVRTWEEHVPMKCSGLSLSTLWNDIVDGNLVGFLTYDFIDLIFPIGP